MNKLINDEGVCRTAPATPGLLAGQLITDPTPNSTLSGGEKNVTCDM